MALKQKEQNLISYIKVDELRRDLLDWYDKNKRVLPWRAVSKQDRNPYHTWLSEIMLQQTTVQTVVPYFLKFTEIWPQVQDLAEAQDDEVMAAWAGLGYYARARNLLKCARTIADTPYDCDFPDTQDELEELPGIGPYTAAAITSIAFDKPAVVIDGNVERVFSRLFAIETPLPDSKKEIRDKAAYLSINREDRPGDYAQSLMDLGAIVCTPTTPKCFSCPLTKYCQAYAYGLQNKLPRKKAKSQKPIREGEVYWIEDKQGNVLFEKRPETNMLGGMTGLPSSDWDNKTNPLFKKPELERMLKNATPASLQENIYVKHTFTHFHLTLDIKNYELIDRYELPETSFWISKERLKEIALPTLFKKVVKIKDL